MLRRAEGDELTPVGRGSDKLPWDPSKLSEIGGRGDVTPRRVASLAVTTKSGRARFKKGFFPAKYVEGLAWKSSGSGSLRVATELMQERVNSALLHVQESVWFLRQREKYILSDGKGLIDPLAFFFFFF